ncbi:calcium/sodium antiporter [candidate division KSB1 bacterium]|nr:calcium/sodium antiporter [candidate division KSB1 bacterium]
MLFTIFTFAIGIAMLYFGADWLVKGSTRFAMSIGVRPLIIGLTLVAMGTSAPEFTVSLISSIREAKDIALGNILGSNIANIGLVIGLAALVRPIKIQVSTIRMEMPLLMAATIALYLLSLDNILDRPDGMILFMGFIFFLVYLYIITQKDRKAERAMAEEINKYKSDKTTSSNLLLFLSGLGILLGGSYLLVKSAVVIAEALGISQIVIGITLVALGTSLPELAVSVVGASKGHGDMTVGNTVGSNLFNMLFVIAIVSIISPIPVHAELLRFEYPAMLGFSFIFYPMMLTGRIVTRFEGIILMFLYAIFIYFLFTSH